MIYNNSIKNYNFIQYNLSVIYINLKIFYFITKLLMNNLFQDKLFYIFNLNGKKIKFFNQRMYSRMFRNFYSLSIWLRSYGPSYSQLGSCRKVFINKFRLVVRTLHRINDNFKNIRRTFESRSNCCIISA